LHSLHHCADADAIIVSLHQGSLTTFRSMRPYKTGCTTL
jgi:hypothetical protein